MLNKSLPVLNDAESSRIPDGLPTVVDAHVHLFPEGIFQSIWNWFDRYAWPIRYRMNAANILDFLFNRGVGHVVALQYAHKPGIAAGLNTFMADMRRKYPNVTGLASVFPGEENAGQILRQAFQSGLDGVKLHAHVQGFDLNSPAMESIYDVCAREGKPLVLHGGREPKSPAYPVDPHRICGAEKIERVLRSFPRLRLCIPHLGFDEVREFRLLMERYDHLWLDTAMVLGDFFPGHRPPDLSTLRSDRIMYGSDFPNLPYAWDREIKKIAAAGLSEDRLERLLAGNARDFFSIQPPDAGKKGGGRAGTCGRPGNGGSAT
ncbi:MAG: amidohydrolase family protein [Thermodesulfobacteriota bacterium]